MRYGLCPTSRSLCVRGTLLSALLLSIFIFPLHGQRHEILSPSIASVQVMVGDNWRGMPISTLNGEAINVSFDELSHEYHRYRYEVEHCEADWTISEGLFASDYMRGFREENVVDDAEESIDTYQLYTHYKLSFPNSQCRLTMSGNYRVTIIDDETDEPVLRVCFMLSENTAGISLGHTSNTDLDINGRYQQLTMQVSYGSLNVTSPDTQLHTVVMQNQRRDNAVLNPRAQYRLRDGLRWEHSRDLIFRAGTEYHKFETLDPTHTTMGLASVGWDKDLSEWHAYVEPDEPQRNYVYDVDANGSFLIRNSDNEENDLMSDYIQTHFELHAPRQQGRVFLSGQWTYGQFLPEYEMIWNDETNVYEAVVKLKQGYYSYRYLVMQDDGTTASLSTEGSFFETENSYQALLYFRAPGDRADRLVAYTDITTRE